MCIQFDYLVPFACRNNPDHVTTYVYLPKSGRRCIETHRDKKGKKHEEIIKAKSRCKKDLGGRQEKTALISFPDGWCPRRSCGGDGMPGGIQKRKHEKIDWRKKVRISVKPSTNDALAWEDALERRGDFADYESSEASTAIAGTEAWSVVTDSSTAPYAGRRDSPISARRQRSD
jgi:hypothetical protein